ncbi:hypothetical protein [Paractinoplanes atraurantiacus]|uniref:Uncharacterized protein n=1 Tax=Paractinoplanes atraurantiacus TaxID=1036182 RepID=A0A285JCQ5_9ACTN|nr:hypothetical protein [Actinoplanes atraurantiacus]SNY57166.1 hypothetical protein SAMN05421748_11869 [Actinoplanes atraurantiacus]
MTEQAPGHRPGIDVTKTIAGTLAAVSAAFLGSFLGVAGTLIGAAVASIVGSVGTELYQRWLNRGTERIKSTFVTAPAAIGTPEVAAAAEESPSGPPPRIRWQRVAMVAGAFFVLAIGSLTAFELVAGRSAADVVQNKASSSSTIGIPLRSTHSDKSNKSDESPVPAESASPSETPDQKDQTGPAESPAPEQSGTTTESPAPADGSTEEPTDAPTTDAPTTDAPAPADEQPQDGDTQQDGQTPQQQGDAGPTAQSGE